MKAKAFSLVFGILLLSTGWSVSHAVVTTNITSSGLGTAVSPMSGGVVTITGGTRPGGDANLFHSFGLFNVGRSDTASFDGTGTSGIANILSRVTGGQPSNIFGRIQTSNFLDTNPNLFLINPAGVIFGSTASLNVGGSFHVSTADYIRLTDGVRFNAVPGPSDALLSSAPVAAFGFLGSNPAAITFGNSLLSVPVGQTLSVVGGNITMTGGTLSAPGGQINLISVASPGEVLLPSFQLAPNVSGGTINLSQGALLDTSGDGGGTVLIRGGKLVMDNAFVSSFSVGTLDGATSAVSVNMDGDVILSNGSGILAGAFVVGRSGDIVVRAHNVQVTGGALINTITLGDGQAGNITVMASGTVSATGTDAFNNPSQISSETFPFTNGSGGAINISAPSVTVNDQAIVRTKTAGSGSAGDLTVQIGNLSVLSGGVVETLSVSSGSAGRVTIIATDTVSVDGQFNRSSPSRISNVSRGLGVGGNGDLSISARNFFLAGGAKVESVNSSATQQGGRLMIGTKESVMISGDTMIITSARDPSNGVGSIAISALVISLDQGIITATTGGAGNAGTLSLNAETLKISGGGRVSSSTVSNGQGGTVQVAASNLVSISGTGSGLFSVTGPFSSGRGGEVNVRANQVALSNQATISATSTGTGAAGNIRITASDSLVMKNRSSITTAATRSDGGDIHIQVGRLVQLTDSQITTSVHGGLGNGGNITIDPQFVILQGSKILAQAFGGNGGNILIVAGVFFADPTSVVSASSTKGISGTVDIQAPVTNLSGTLAPLPGEIVQAAEMLQARCAARLTGGTASSFVVAGRDGLPLEPGGLLPSLLSVDNTGSSRMAGTLDIPGLRVGRTLAESNLTLAPLAIGCSS